MVPIASDFVDLCGFLFFNHRVHRVLCAFSVYLCGYKKINKNLSTVIRDVHMKYAVTIGAISEKINNLNFCDKCKFKILNIM